MRIKQLENNKEIYNNYNIVHLPKEQWKDTIIFMKDDVDSDNNSEKLYQEEYNNAYAWGVFDGDGDNARLIACIETCPMEEANTIEVIKLWVDNNFRRQGIGHSLMLVAKEQANLEYRKAIVIRKWLENEETIKFFENEGFKQMGDEEYRYLGIENAGNTINASEYAYFTRKPKVNRENVIVREEEVHEYHKVEEVVLRAFWNKHGLGCNEHLLVHKLRDSDVYIPEISRIAEVDGEIVGVICYAKAELKNGDNYKEILLFGPLCVAPEWQGCGIGGILLDETLKLAKVNGYEGVIIFGEPDYYPLHGFKTCDNYGITTIDGSNFDAFLGIELVEGGLKDFGGVFIEPKVFEDLPEEENEEFTKTFDAPKKQKFPCQWD